MKKSDNQFAILYTNKSVSFDSVSSVSKLIYFIGEKVYSDALSISVIDKKFIDEYFDSSFFKRLLKFIYKIKCKVLGKKLNFELLLKTNILDNINVVISVSMSEVILLRHYGFNSKIIYWPHNLPTNQVELGFFMKAVNLSDVLICINNSFFLEVAKLMNYGGFFPDVFIIPNPILDSFKNNRLLRSNNYDGINIVFVGGDNPTKGLNLLYYLFIKNGIVFNKYEKLNLHICGNVKNKLDSHFSNINFIYHGLLSTANLNLLYQSMDYAFLPSKWFENHSLALLEFMNSNLFVFCSDVGGIREILESSRYSKYFMIKNSMLNHSWHDIFDFNFYDSSKVVNNNLEISTESIRYPSQNEIIEKWLDVLT